MRKILIFLSLMLLGTITTNAFELSIDDKARLNDFRLELSRVSSELGKDFFVEKLPVIDNAVDLNKKNIKNWIILTEIRRSFKQTIKQFEYDEKLRALSDTSKYEIDFLNKNGKNILGSKEIDSRCMENYDFVDSIALREDFPTALIIASWSIEHNCFMDNPNNGRGIFQIMSNHYTPGPVGKVGLEKQIIDFIKFSRDNKWAYFNNLKDTHSYKQKYGSENIDIHYNKYSMRDLRLHSILYNGIRADTTLEFNTYTNNNLDSSRAGNYDGLVTRFIKVLYTINKDTLE